ncbi:class II fructose-bisphosphate aldolase [Cohaesibacter gelatinilyticus]|uniref:Fructose-bisphosphate aldolase n=1 Tax=Cohaesibacter gelatinilyticus TaxID=372072 RepID=A0A285PI23_9HYPH|nr:class II fructose-bisphosphate aldolase [Cohaesibacter gelatinilyticus]SNZ21375.1 fructose-bisphosphate aldolase [Cohaesibacter gelatinilyticus]
MPLATLKDVLAPAKEQGYAVAGFVVLGWEDARAYVRAAEATNSPVILQAGPGCRAHTPLEVLAPMFRHLAETASVDVVAHLDHGYEAADCFKAVDLGFSSVMFDGSKLAIEENIEITRSIADYAHKHGVSVEGEVGYVGYAEGANSAGTKVGEAALFARQSGADAMAISIGNVHLQQEQAAEIDFDLLRKIEADCDIPLVLHGGSGIPSAVRQKLAQSSHVSKFNIGTEVRMAFGKSLRDVLSDNPDMFDRISILKPTEEAVFEAAKQVIKPLLPRS